MNCLSFQKPSALAALVVSLFATANTQAQFSNSNAGLPATASPAAAWGDFDGDGDLDLALAGETEGDKFTRIFRNDNGTFTDINAAIAGVHFGAVAWGDYDNDGDLDLALLGESNAGRITRVYRNNAGTFVQAASLTGVQSGSLAWGDYDNDGDLDLLVTGATGTGANGFANTLTRLYRNDNGSFVAVTTDLPNVYLGSVAWGDYDNDGDLDILIGGDTGSFGALCAIYENVGGVFTLAVNELPAFDLGKAVWGDYDQDGELDIAIVGSGVLGGMATILRNDFGQFIDIGANLTGVLWGSAAWGDFDNDGDLDLAVIGHDGTVPISKVYRNDDSLFVDSGSVLQPLYLGQVAWGDYNDDGRLDLMLAGTGDANEGDFALIYRNLAATANTPPTEPSDLIATPLPAGSVTLEWSAAADTQTAPSGLSYNLRLGTAPGGLQRVTPQAIPASGVRCLPAFGNAQHTQSLTLNGLTPGQTYYWSVQAVDNNFAGSPFAPESSFVMPAGNTAPVITVQPVDQSVVEGGSASFSVVATGAAPLSYQWQKDGSDLSGAINATLTFNAVTAGQTGSYTVRVSNSAGAVTSAPAVLAIGFKAPTIITEPVSQVVTEGDSATFSVAVTGTAPFSYQWLKNDADIPGETQASLTLTGVTLDHAGTYRVRVSNSAGSNLSAVATLTVNPVPPSITSGPVSQTVPEGASVSFAVTAAGTAPLRYQWQKDGADIAGATSATLNLGPVTLDQAGNYTVQVSNLAGTVTSAAAILAVTPLAPSILTEPASQSVVEGTNVSFSVTATGTAPLSYQWLRDGADISGANGSTLTLNTVAYSQAGAYAVRVTNPGGSVTSAAASLTVKPLAPRIVTAPVSQTITEGEGVTFTVVASSSAPLTYAWQKDGIGIPGATSSNLVLTSVLANQAGAYAVRVSNEGGSVFSAAATLTVLAVAPVITIGPASQSVTEGGGVTFSVTATGTNPLSYQWQKDGTDLAGATNASLALTAVALSQAGAYTVRVSNTADSVTSAAATLTVNPSNEVPTAAIALQASGTIHLSWSAVPGKTYRVQYSVDLATANWIDLGDVTASENFASLTDNIEGTLRFYRVRALP